MDTVTVKSKPVIGKGPFLRSVDEGRNSTGKMMRNILIAVLPLVIFGWVKNGIIPFFKYDNVSFITMIWPLLFVVVGAFTSIALECLYFTLFKGIKGPKELLKAAHESYAIIPGVLLALILPLYTPMWMLMLGCLFANIVFKMLFGGFGHNIFNPALIGYAFIMTMFAGSLSGSYFSAFDLYNTTASVTPLGVYNGNLAASYEVLVAPFGSLWDFFFGTTPGSIGETSAFLIIAAYVFLVVTKTINWYVPAIYVGTVFGLTWIIGAVNGQGGIWYPLYNVLSGGLLFGAVFMATEPVTAPKTPNGKIIFSLLLGVFTVLFRCIGSMNEGVATSILFMCLFSNIIDKFCAKIRAQGNDKKAIISACIKYACIGLLIIAIAVFAVVQSKSRVKVVEMGADNVLTFVRTMLGGR